MTCAIDGCDRKSRKRGWCETHYSRWRAHGTPLAPGRINQSPECSEDGCSERPIARNLCKRHYYRARAAAARGNKPAAAPYVPPPCAVSGCDATSTARGWCGAHYQRWRRHGDPTFVPPQVKTECRIEGCQKAVNARKLCGSHYYRWQRYGDPLAGATTIRVVVNPARPIKPCATCGMPFVMRSARHKYCGRRCRPTRAHRGANNRATVLRLASRDGWTCRLCGTGIDPDLYWPNLRAGSVDHVLAVIDGGDDADENLQLSHLACNFAKEGARRSASSKRPT